jgi:hypothetical protein
VGWLLVGLGLSFAARLRDQVDLDAVGGELLAVVDQTMQSTRASLWLRPRAGPGASERLAQSLGRLATHSA